MSDAAFALFFADFSLSHNFLNVDVAKQAWTKLPLRERALWQRISDGAKTDGRSANSTPPKRYHYPRAHYDSVPPSSRPHAHGVTQSYNGTGGAVDAASNFEDRIATQARSSHPVLNQSIDIPIPEIASVEDFWNFVEA